MDYVKAKHIITRGPGDSWFGGDYNMNIWRNRLMPIFPI